MSFDKQTVEYMRQLSQREVVLASEAENLDKAFPPPRVILGQVFRPEDPRRTAAQAKWKIVMAEREEVIAKGTSMYQTQVIDHIKRSLPEGTIAFNAPAYAPLDEETYVVFLVSKRAQLPELRQSVADALRRLDQPLGASRFPDLIAERVKISNVMSASLTGTNFDITSQGPDTKAISSDADVKWTWTIKPRTAGEHLLTLTLSAIVQPAGQPVPYTIKTYERSIVVPSGPFQWTMEFLKANKEVFGGATAVLVFLWTLWKVLRRKNPARGEV